MAAISQKIVSLIGGVSQQPDSVKFSNQLRRCDNYYPDVALGLTKRPGLQGIKKLANTADNGTWFTIFRDDKEKYICQFSKAGALKIWNANSGIQQTVNTVASESTAYAVHKNQEDLQTLQINDYTFVLNKTIDTVAGATYSPVQNPYAFVTINTVAYSSTYTITVDGSTSFAYPTPTTSTTQLNIKDIVTNLRDLINGNAAWVAQGIGNTIHIQKANNTDFAIEAKGGSTGTSIEAYKGSVISVAQLPKQFINNTKIKIAGSVDSSSDDYWVVFKTSDNTNTGAGIWQETIAPNTLTNLNATTLPHAIIREGNGTFTYRQLDEASALASIGAISVGGIPTAISVISATTGGHVVGEKFAAIGGTGKNLSVLVTKTKTVTIANTYAANSSSYVQKITTQSSWGKYQSTTIKYDWYLSGFKIGQTQQENDSLVVGNTTYLINSAYQNISGQTRAGITSLKVTNGVIDTISIQRAGEGYTALDSFTNTAGDSFRIDSVTTKSLTGDDLALQYWKYRSVGDGNTSPLPSFIGYPIDSISFFKNRIVFTSRENVICSQAGDYFNFFASTVITLVDNDPVDISASSLKPVRFKYSLPVPRGLALFGDNAQYILETTTEAFAPKTAEVNRLSAFSQSDKIAPIDIGPSFLFIEQGDKASSVFEMNIGDNIGGKPEVIELTRLIPSYIPAALINLKVSQTAGVVSMLSAQEPSSIYLYRFFNNGDSRISGWFKWNLPGTVETFDFDQDIMYIVTKHGANYVLSSVSLLTETPSNSLIFDGEYLDVRLDLFDYNPTLVYFAGTKTTHICFKDGFEDTNEQPVLMYLDPEITGSFEEQSLTVDLTQPVGQRYFLSVDGNQTASKFAIGYKYEAVAELPAFYFIKDESRALKDTLNIPRINRILIDSYNSGPYKAIVKSEGRDTFSLALPQINADYYRANNIPIVRNAQSTVPIMAKGTQFELQLIADSPFPTAFTSLTWEGAYNNKGIKSL